VGIECILFKKPHSILKKEVVESFIRIAKEVEEMQFIT
jgi:hypothetical protein